MVTLPAPIGGWNARDAFAAMPPIDAIELINFFPRPDKITSRGGHASFATGLGSSVETLVEWTGPSSKKFKGIAGTSIFDITSGGAVGAAEVTGLSSARFQSVMFNTGGAAILVICDGVSTVRNYDGTNWTVPAITGVTSSTLVNVCLYRGRLIFTQKDTLRAWYLPPNSISGAASMLDIGRDARKGGYLVAVGTWTQDSGEGGTDDLAVFVTSEGQVVIYGGNDPSSASSWGLVGVYDCGKPIGRRCMMRYGKDLCLILQDGFYPVSALLASGVSDPQLALSDKIRNAFVAAQLASATTFGWEAIYYANGQRVLVNVPVIGGTFDQYVMNSITKAWCRFTNINPNTFALFNSDLYCGKSNGTVYKLESGDLDITSPIQTSGRQAFSDLSQPTAEKYLTMFRPKIGVNGTVNVSAQIDFDYQNNPVIPTGVMLSGTGTLWDAGLWDVSPWFVGEQIFGQWFTYGGIGRVASAHLSANTRSSFSWYETDFLMQGGGVL
jgi:hypothetical protein